VLGGLGSQGTLLATVASAVRVLCQVASTLPPALLSHFLGITPGLMNPTD
jgi:hypothetical protein